MEQREPWGVCRIRKQGNLGELHDKQEPAGQVEISLPVNANSSLISIKYSNIYNNHQIKYS